MYLTRWTTLYSGLYQLVHDGKLGLLCLQWVPPPPRMGLQLPMTLQKFFSVSLAGLDIREQKRRCTPPSRWYQAVYKVRRRIIHLGTKRNSIKRHDFQSLTPVKWGLLLRVRLMPR